MKNGNPTAKTQLITVARIIDTMFISLYTYIVRFITHLGRYPKYEQGFNSLPKLG